MFEGSIRIANERFRQVVKEGWDSNHDDNHDHNELAEAAIAYLNPEPQEEDWGYTGWSDEWDKRPRLDNGSLMHAIDMDIDTRIRCLEKAGALVSAEIDRLIRKKWHR